MENRVEDLDGFCCFLVSLWDPFLPVSRVPLLLFFPPPPLFPFFFFFSPLSPGGLTPEEVAFNIETSHAPLLLGVVFFSVFTFSLSP